MLLRIPWPKTGEPPARTVRLQRSHHPVFTSIGVRAFAGPCALVWAQGHVVVQQYPRTQTETASTGVSY